MTVASKLLLFLSLFLVVATALPFSKESGVIEATPKTFKGLLKTHKPIFVMIYAPWCGHCKAMHGDYEKFAKNMKGMARVIAVNGDAHKELSSQFGVQGFPTIKYYGMGDKTKLKPQDYQGERKAGAMTKAAMGLVKNDFVTTIKKSADIDAAIDKASSGKAAILVSNKGSIPPMWAVVAGSSQLSAAKFVFATDKQSEITKALGVSSYPTIAVVSKGDDGYTVEKYGGAIEYDGIAKFVLGQLSGESAGKGEDSKNAETEAEEAPKKEEEKKKKEPSNPKPALPVTPTPLAKHSLDFYCSSKSMKIKGQSPLCVIAASEERSLADVHAKYGNAPVLFFNAQDEDDMKTIAKALGNDVAIGPNDVLFLRSFKDNKAKYIVMKDGEDLDNFLSRVLEGTVVLSKSDAFPKL